MSEEIDANAGSLRKYRTPWKGQLVLACRKCQKKLKHEGKQSRLAKLSKTLKKLARRDVAGPALHIVDVSCLKLCPKGGVTVCTEEQLGRNECSIVRNKSDLLQLLEQCKRHLPGVSDGAAGLTDTV